MSENDNTYCLVLAGGGAKGVYHVGVWKALQEIGVKVNAFIGNSIGAIVAGFLAQGASKKMEEIGSQLGLDFVLNVPDEFIENGEFKFNSSKLADFKKFYSTTFTKKGLDTSPLRNLLTSNLDEEKIRTSGNDLGVVTYNVSDLKSKEIYIEDMENGHLIDYLMASSAVPGFEQPEIAGKKYIDGGVYDNIPYTMAQKRGYKRIIVVDISGMGVKRKLRVEGGQLIYIKNSINMGGLLDFNREFLDNFTKLGYLDTLRTFDRLKGYSYFLVPQPELEQQFKETISEPENQQKILCFAEDYFGKEQRTFSLALKEIFPEYACFEKHWLVVFCDCAATILSIERIQMWNFESLFTEIKSRYDSMSEEIDKLSFKDIKTIEDILKKKFTESHLVEPAFYYYLFIDRKISGTPQKLLKKALFALVPELAAGSFFISEMKGFWEYYIIQKIEK